MENSRSRGNRVLPRTKTQIELFSTFIFYGDMVFDVGANIGNRIEAFRSCGATVVAIEPQPDCIAHLSKAYHRDTGVFIVPAAAGSRDGEMPLRRARSSDPAASMSNEFILRTSESGRFPNRPYNEYLFVEVVTLDNLIKRFGKPSFVKIDVEGFEEQVLAGLSTRVDMLSFEWTPEMPDHASQCMRRCECLGLTHFHISFNESMRFCHPRSISRPEMESLITSLSTDSVLFGDIYASASEMTRGCRRTREGE